MERLLLLIFIFFAAIVYGQDNPGKPAATRKFTLPPGISHKEFVPNTLIVKLRAGQAAHAKIQSSNKAIASLKSVSVVAVKKLFKDSPLGATVRSSGYKKPDPGLGRIYEINYSGNDDIESVINELLQDSTVEYAEPRYIARSSLVPNDPRFISQSYLNTIKAPQAWNFVNNSSMVLIGIVDSGSDLNHEDLAANIYLNSADPVNGLDDDRDGYVDNYRGWDFVGSTATNIVEDNDPNVKNDAADHGVHVSGIASAVTNNGLGVSSVAFNAKLLIVKTGADDDGTSIHRGYEGIKYAVDKGALIINCSWGSVAGGSYGADIVNYALSKGCLIVAAAGNSNTEQPEYPAGYPGVLSVANVNESDTRNNSSNYGYSVDLAAPGTGIISTVRNNRYTSYSGTSMATPIVSSTAALVKTRFPSYTMQQVGEQLRVTADFIDDKNPGYEGKLGKGRINVLRAITESVPSIRYQKLAVVDKANGAIPAGDTIKLYFDLKNFLSSVSQVTVTLSSINPYVRILTPPVNIGSIATGETKSMAGPFKVVIAPDIPDNTPVEFRIDYNSVAGSYQDFETFIINAARDYLDVTVNQVSTTMTSVGRIGFSKADGIDGLGFLYKNESLLYEASLMIGNAPSRVSNNTRGVGGASNEHFIKKVRATLVNGSSAAFEARAEFDDSGSPDPLNIHVNHRVLAYSTAPDDKYVIAEYTIKNGTSSDIKNVYVGLFTDWDVDDDGKDVTKYDVANRLGYVFAKGGNKPYAGVRLLSKVAEPAYYPLSYQVVGSPLQSGGFTTAEMYETLSGGIKSTGLGENSANGFDVMFVLGAGPYTIKAGGSITVAFALIGGDNINDLTSSAVAAQAKYDALNYRAPLPAISDDLVLKQNYPNPVTSFTTIEYNIPFSDHTSLSVYNILGQRVKSIINQNMDAGYYSSQIDLSDLPGGVYIYKLHSGGKERSLKLNIEK